MGLVRGGSRGCVSGVARPSGAIFLKTPEKPMGEVCALSRARKQARDTRRRRHARGHARAIARGKGWAPLPIGQGDMDDGNRPRPPTGGETGREAHPAIEALARYPDSA